MNKYIKRELDKIRAKSTPYDDSTTYIHFYRSDNPAPIEEQEYSIGVRYRISIEDYIINEPSNFTLSSNWNNGVKPVSKVLEGILKQIYGDMLQWDLVGFDEDQQCEKSDRYTDLWLPRKSITVLGMYRFIV